MDPVYGTLCASHGGRRDVVRKKAAERRGLAAIRDDLDRLGCIIDVEPSEAMLIMVRESAANVVYLRGLVQQLKGTVGDAGPVLMDEEGVARVSPAWIGDGIAQRVDPNNWRSEPHVIVRMYNEERERLVKFAKLCRDAGVDERMVQIAEQQGQWLANMLDNVFASLELSEKQQNQLPAIMGKIIAELETPGGA